MWTDAVQCNFADFCPTKIHFNVEKLAVVSAVYAVIVFSIEIVFINGIFWINS